MRRCLRVALLSRRAARALYDAHALCTSDGSRVDERDSTRLVARLAGREGVGHGIVLRGATRARDGGREGLGLVVELLVGAVREGTRVHGRSVEAARVDEDGFTLELVRVVALSVARVLVGLRSGCSNFGRSVDVVRDRGGGRSGAGTLRGERGGQLESGRVARRVEASLAWRSATEEGLPCC